MPDRRQVRWFYRKEEGCWCRWLMQKLPVGFPEDMLRTSALVTILAVQFILPKLKEHL